MEYAKHFYILVVDDHNTLILFVVVVVENNVTRKMIKLNYTICAGTDSISTKISENFNQFCSFMYTVWVFGISCFIFQYLLVNNIKYSKLKGKNFFNFNHYSNNFFSES